MFSFEFNDLEYRAFTRKFCDDFFHTLPRYVQTSIDKNDYFFAPKHGAINNPWIQVNHKNLIRFLIIDIDEAEAYSLLHDSHLPLPTYISINRENGHLQAGWKLATPVSTSPNSRPEPQRYLKSIRAAFNERLSGDSSFSDNVAKNPLHDHWINYYYDNEYSLEELADQVRLCKKVASVLSAGQLNDDFRNTSLFDVARKWAYKEIRQDGNKPLYDTWEKTLLAHCEALSEKFSSLEDFTYREIKSIARSIANYTFKRWSEFTDSAERYSAAQAKRGKLGGKISKRGASSQKIKLLPTINTLYKDKNSYRVIANVCKIAPSTVSRWLKEINDPLYVACSI